MNKLIFKLIRLSGMPILFRELIQRKKITILLYHDLNSKTAEKHFSHLLKKYNVIDLNTLINAIEEKDFSEIPKKALIITFDDGHIGNYHLLPIIKKIKIPITIFLCANIINTNRHFWFKFIENKISSNQLKTISNDERLNKLTAIGFCQETEYESPQALQDIHINEMKQFINMQSHTLFHPILPKCKNEVAKSEIFESKKTLENKYKLNINTISYPNGDYSDRDIKLSKEAGYKCGITVDYGFNTIKTDPFKLKRISVNDTNDLNELIVKSSGIWAFFKTRNGRKQKFGY